MTKPTVFTGAMEQWADWSFVFKAYCAAINPRMTEMMLFAQNSKDVVVMNNLTDHQLTSQLYYMLVLLAKDRALELVRNSPEGNGAEVWRRLLWEYEPGVGVRYGAILQGLLRLSSRIQR